MQERKPGRFAADFRPDFKRDLPSSVVVFLVALPLCMGIAIASGVPVAAGLVTGIVGGLVVGWLAGSPLQVSGPAAGLTVIVYEIVQRFGLEMFGLVVLMAGALQVAAGLFQLGPWFRAVSPAVIKGMLAGIGVLILASQFHVMVDDKPRGSGGENLAAIPAAVWKSLEVPQFHDREERRFRSELLREIADLHRRQADIRGQLSGLLAEPTQDDSSPAEGQAADSDLSTMAQRQEEITQDLAAIVSRLENFDQQGTDAEGAGQRLEAAAAAVEQSETASEALRSEDAAAALEAQGGVVERLEMLLDSLKNHNIAAYVGLLTIILIVTWQVLPQKFRTIPGPLVAVVVATLAAAAMALPVLYVQVPDQIWSDLHFPTFEILSTAPWMALAQAAVLMAAVASAETLLCATAVDQLHNGPRTNYDRELLAQGVGNTICGLLGALPMTGVIVRSSANVGAGAKTRYSAILHGLWLLIFVVFLGFLLRLIPTASLAAVLVYTGYKLVDPKSLHKLRQYGWGEVTIYAATVSTIVFVDLLSGVLVGIALSALKLLYMFSYLDTDLHLDLSRNRATLKLRGAATFVRLPRLAAELDRVPQAAELHVDCEHLDYIDHACLDLLMNWAKQHESMGGTLILDWEALHGRFYREKTVALKQAPEGDRQPAGEVFEEVTSAKS